MLGAMPTSSSTIKQTISPVTHLNDIITSPPLLSTGRHSLNGPLNQPPSQTINHPINPLDSIVARYDQGSSLQCFSISPHLNQIAVGGKDIRLLSVNQSANLTSSQYGQFVPIRTGSFAATSMSNIAINDLSFHWSINEATLLLCAPTTGSILLYNLGSDSQPGHSQNANQPANQPMKRSAHVFEDHTRSVVRVDWHSTDSSIFFSGSLDGSIRQWDIRSNTRRSVNQSIETSMVRDISIHPTTNHIVAGCYENGSINLIDSRSMGKPYQTINAHQSICLSIDWHPTDQSIIASGGMDFKLKIWDTVSLLNNQTTNQSTSSSEQTTTRTTAQSNNQPLQSINCAHSIGHVKWRPNRSYQLACCASLYSSEITLFNYPTPYIPLGVLKSHSDCVTDLVFSASGDAVYSCSKDGTIQRNRLTDFSEPLQNMSLCALAFSPTDELGFFNEKVDRTISLINHPSSHSNNQTKPPPIFLQHFQHPSNAALRGKIKVMDTHKALSEQSVNHSDGIPELMTDISDVQAALYLARNYQLIDDPSNNVPIRTRQANRNNQSFYQPTSIAARCQHNRQMAINVDRHNIAHLWSVVQLLYGDENEQSINQSNQSNSESDTDVSNASINQSEHSNHSDEYLDYSIQPDKNFNRTLALSSVLPRIHRSNCYNQTSNKAINQSIKPSNKHSINQSHARGLLELNSYRQEVLYAALMQLVEFDGDVQTASSVAMVLQDVVSFPVSSTRPWFHAYIDQLHRCQLHSEAAFIAATCEDEWVARHTAHSTTFTLMCAKCRATSRTVGALCADCNAQLSTCAICEMPVNGLYVWCQGCAHGGHVEHWNEWFQNYTVCPTGCLHQCVPHTLKIVNNEIVQ